MNKGADFCRDMHLARKTKNNRNFADENKLCTQTTT